MLKILLSVFIFFTIVQCPAYAQNEENPAAQAELNQINLPHQVVPPKFISAEVLNVDVSNPEVTILTIKDINDQEVEMEVGPNLSITKIISPDQLNIGDNIRITYEEKDDKKTIRNIFLGRPHPVRTEPAP